MPNSGISVTKQLRASEEVFLLCSSDLGPVYTLVAAPFFFPTDLPRSGAQVFQCTGSKIRGFTSLDHNPWPIIVGIPS